MKSSRKKLTKEQVSDVFREVQFAENTFWNDIEVINDSFLKCIDRRYELAVIAGEVVGIGYVDKDGNKKLVHHRS